MTDKPSATALVEARKINQHATHGLRGLVDMSLDSKSTSQTRVRTFHRVYGMPNPDRPTSLSITRRLLRLNLILEEFLELLEASGFELRATVEDGVTEVNLYHVEGTQQDHLEMLDALGDLEYVIRGMAIEMGQNLDNVIQEIHASNMTKLGEDGLPIYREDGKVLKGPNYMKPQLARIIHMPNNSEI